MKLDGMHFWILLCFKCKAYISIPIYHGVLSGNFRILKYYITRINSSNRYWKLGYIGRLHLMLEPTSRTRDYLQLENASCTSKRKTWSHVLHINQTTYVKDVTTMQSTREILPWGSVKLSLSGPYFWAKLSPFSFFGSSGKRLVARGRWSVWPTDELSEVFGMSRTKLPSGTSKK